MITNLSQLKYQLYKLYQETDDINSLVNDSVRLGMLAERYSKDEDREMELQEVFDEYDRQYGS